MYFKKKNQIYFKLSIFYKQGSYLNIEQISENYTYFMHNHCLHNNLKCIYTFIYNKIRASIQAIQLKNTKQFN